MNESDTPQYDPTSDEIQFFRSPWVSGTRTEAHFGQIHASIFSASRDWEKCWREMRARMADQARALGANAIVGLEETFDPFAWEDGVSGVRLEAVGLSARLSRLWVEA